MIKYRTWHRKGRIKMKKLSTRGLIYIFIALMGMTGLSACAVHTQGGVIRATPKPIVVVDRAPTKIYHNGRWLYYRSNSYMYWNSGRWVHARHVPSHVSRYHRPVHVHTRTARVAAPVHRAPQHRHARPVHVRR